MSYLDDVIVPQIRQQGRTRFDFLGNCLPNSCEPTDIDNLFERHGHFLIFEFKQPGEEMPRGQEIALQALLKLNRGKVALLQVEGIPPEEIHRYRWLSHNGNWRPSDWLPGDAYTVRELVRHWWAWVEQERR